MKNKPTIAEYILANPRVSAKEVIKTTGAKATSVHTMFTWLRRVYREAGINAAGVYAPEGFPPLTQEDYDALNERRFSYKRNRKPIKIEGKVKVVKSKKPIDLTAYKLMEEKDPPMPAFKTAPLSPDQILNIWTHMSGKAEGLSEAGVSVSFPLLFARAIEQWHGVSS